MKFDEKMLDMFTEDDMEFYEKFLVNLSEEELAKFLEENPDFLQE